VKLLSKKGILAKSMKHLLLTIDPKLAIFDLF
jgi:hypothetical protein